MPKVKAVALFDISNMGRADFARVAVRARELGAYAGGLHAYADWFRDDPQQHLAKSLLSLGFELHHCPSWPNGAKDASGKPQLKRSDDPILHAAIFRTLERQPAIDILILGGADADVIHAATTAWLKGKEVIVLYDPHDNSLGHVMKRCPFRFESVPIGGDVRQADAMLNPNLARKFIREVEALKARDPRPDFLTKTYLRSNLNGFSPVEILDLTNHLIYLGALEVYEHTDQRYGHIRSALRLNDGHPLVREAILEDRADKDEE